ncbi:MAG: PadR family transcriptional regulator [Candidatus Promineifilaceae bacterium]
MAPPSLSLELALLGFVRQQPNHGYAIHQALSNPAGLGPVWQIKLSQLYALLGKLEEAGYLTTSTEPQENKPPRKLFHLTPEGETIFLQWVQTPVSNGRSLRLDFLVKLYFAHQESKEIAARLLASQRAQCHSWLAAEQEIAAEEVERGQVYGRLVHQFRAGQIQAMLAWLDQCEEELSGEN